MIGVLGASEATFTQWIMLIGAIAGLTIVMVSTHRRIRRGQREPGSSALKRYEELDRGQKGQRDIETVMIELDKLARQINGRIDTRFAKLETVIRDADERIEKLARLIRASQGEPQVDVTVDEHSSTPEPENRENGEDIHSAIYTLADSGLSNAEIAKETGKTSGEIELIIALRSAREGAKSKHLATPAG